MRSIFLLLAGIIGGSTLALIYLAHTSTEPASARAHAAIDSELSAPTSGFEAERIAIYEQAAHASSAADLELLIESAARKPRSLSRDLELEVALARLAELDVARAAGLGEDLALDADLLAAVYRTWIAMDQDAAINAVANIESPFRQRTFALALLEGPGNAPASVGSIAAALPVDARFGFEHSALLMRATNDPAGALAAAFELADSRARQLAIPAVAARIAEVDPLAALALGESIPNEFGRNEYSRAVIETWAAHSPDSLIDYLESADRSALLGNDSLLQAAARGAPEYMLDFAETLPRGSRYDLQYMALGALAERDAVLALTRLQAIGGQNLSALANSIARAYGTQDPAAAVAWSRSLTPASQAVRESVLQGVAGVDYAMAIDLAVSELADYPRGPVAGSTGMLSLVTASDADPALLLSRVLDAELGEQANRAVGQIMSLWARTDPDRALEWALAAARDIDPATMTEIVRDLSRANPEAASRAMARLAPDQREAWIPGIASSLAQTGVDNALEFLEPYRGQPGYDAGYGAVLQAIGNSEPERAARLLAESPAAVPLETTLTIAGGWSVIDPDAATRWLTRLTDEPTRNAAIAGFVMARASQSPDAARQWLLDLPAGSLRDAGLNTALITNRNQGSAIDPRLLDAYSTDAARQQGVGRLAVLTGRSNPDAGRRLLATHVTDPTLRLQFEEILSRPGDPPIDMMRLIAGEPIR